MPKSPNGRVQLPRAPKKRSQKTNDLAREAVGWNDMFGAPAAASRDATRMRRPHHPGTTPAGRAFGRNHAHLEPHPAQRASIWIHAQHRTRLSITGNLHNGPAYHTCTTGNLHNAPAYQAGTTGFGTTDLAQHAFKKCDSPYPHRKGVPTTFPGRRTVCLSAAASAPPTIF